MAASTSNQPQLSKKANADGLRLSSDVEHNLRNSFYRFKGLHVGKLLYINCPENDNRVVMMVTDDYSLWKEPNDRPFASLFSGLSIVADRSVQGQDTVEEMDKFCERLRAEICDDDDGGLKTIYWSFHETKNGRVHYLLSTTADFDKKDFLVSSD